MVSGFEKRMLSGMFGLLSVDCPRAGEVAPATASMTVPATTRLRETWVENCCESSDKSVSAIVSAPAISAGSIVGRVTCRAQKNRHAPLPRGARIGLQLVRFGTIRVGRPSVDLG